MDERAPSPQLISALAQQGLAVSAEALIVAVEGAEQWTISDPLNELELNISATQSRLIIYDGVIITNYKALPIAVLVTTRAMNAGVLLINRE